MQESSDAVFRAAQEQGLGELVDELPVQKRGFSGSYKDTGDFVYRFQQGFVDAPADFPPTAMRFTRMGSIPNLPLFLTLFERLRQAGTA